MALISRIRQFDVVRFNRTCAMVGLAFLILTVGARVARDLRAHNPSVQDFPQYYMAGVIARTGNWDVLFPIPRPGYDLNPGLGWNSEVWPKYKQLADERGVDPLATRFIQLPIVAVACIPLSFLTLTAAWICWTILSLFAVWGIALQSARVLGICLERKSHLAGGLMLLICLSPQAHRFVRVSNMSALMGRLIGYSLLELVRRDSPRAAIALSIGTIAKYLSLVLGPMYIALARWRTIVWGIAFTVVALALTLPVTGLQVYRTFQRDILPTLSLTAAGIPENQSLYPVLLRAMGLQNPPLPNWMEISRKALQWVSLLAILAIIATRPRSFWTRENHAFAGAMALLTWLLIFSPICWEHYHAYLVPLWGWMIFEAMRSRVRLLLAISAIALSLLPISLLLRRVHATLFLALVLMFVLAIVVLLERRDTLADDAE